MASNSSINAGIRQLEDTSNLKKIQKPESRMDEVAVGTAADIATNTFHGAQVLAENQYREKVHMERSIATSAEDEQKRVGAIPIPALMHTSVHGIAAIKEANRSKYAPQAESAQIKRGEEIEERQYQRNQARTEEREEQRYQRSQARAEERANKKETEQQAKTRAFEEKAKSIYTAQLSGADANRATKAALDNLTEAEGVTSIEEAYRTSANIEEFDSKTRGIQQQVREKTGGSAAFDQLFTKATEEYRGYFTNGTLQNNMRELSNGLTRVIQTNTTISNQNEQTTNALVSTINQLIGDAPLNKEEFLHNAVVSSIQKYTDLGAAQRATNKYMEAGLLSETEATNLIKTVIANVATKEGINERIIKTYQKEQSAKVSAGLTADAEYLSEHEKKLNSFNAEHALHRLSPEKIDELGEQNEEYRAHTNQVSSTKRLDFNQSFKDAAEKYGYQDASLIPNLAAIIIDGDGNMLNAAAIEDSLQRITQAAMNTYLALDADQSITSLLSDEDKKQIINVVSERENEKDSTIKLNAASKLKLAGLLYKHMGAHMDNFRDTKNSFKNLVREATGNNLLGDYVIAMNTKLDINKNQPYTKSELQAGYLALVGMNAKDAGTYKALASEAIRDAMVDAGVNMGEIPIETQSMLDSIGSNIAAVTAARGMQATVYSGYSDKEVPSANQIALNNARDLVEESVKVIRPKQGFFGSPSEAYSPIITDSDERRAGVQTALNRLYFYETQGGEIREQKEQIDQDKQSAWGQITSGKSLNDLYRMGIINIINDNGDPSKFIILRPSDSDIASLEAYTDKQGAALGMQKTEIILDQDGKPYVINADEWRPDKPRSSSYGKKKEIKMTPEATPQPEPQQSTVQKKTWRDRVNEAE